MAIALPQSVKKILQDKAYGHVITFSVDGKPQVTMVWIDVDGDRLHRAAGEPQRCAGVDTRWFSVGGRDGVRAAGRWRTFDILLKLPILVPPGQTARRLGPRACAR